MFRSTSTAEFESSGHKAYLVIDNGMPVPAVQEVLNKLMHFCVERMKDAENEEAQRLKDEEAAKPVELEEASAEETEAAELKEEPVPVTE